MSEELDDSDEVAAPTYGVAAAFPSEAEMVGAFATLAVASLDVGGTIRLWNTASEALFGLPASEVLGRPFSELPFAVQDTDARAESVIDIAARQGSFEYTKEYLRPHGASWTGVTVITAVRTPPGELRGFALTTQALPQKSAPGPAPADASILQLLVEGVQDYGIFSLDPVGRIQSWNRGAQNIKGYAAAEILGKHFSVFYTERDVARGWPTQELSLAAAQGRYEDEGWRVRKDGSQFWANVVITAIRAPDGALLGFSKITRDLTERRRQQELLTQREEDFRLLVEGVHGHAMFLVDPDGAIQTWNAGAQRLLGYAASEVVGKPTTVLYTEADRNSAQFSLALQNARERGQIVFKAWRQRADGTGLWVEVSTTALWNVDGTPRGFVQVIRDLSDAARVEELESEGRRTAEFIAMLSHELRNPLAPIRNAATLLKQFAYKPETAAWCADVVDRQVKHMTRLVDDLLDVSRVANGKIRVQTEPCDLRQVVHEAVESLGPMFQARGHRLHVSLPAGSMMTMADGTRLTQVVVNLLTNAAKYTLDPGTVTVSLENDDNWATLEVSDTGIGMSIAMLERAFEPFVQGEQTLARSEGGLGVGLTLVKSVVHLHGGTVSAQSPGEGQGTVFTVRLPLELTKAGSGSSDETNTQGTRPLKVLVVDDNTDAADSVAMMLRLEGHDVEVAYDGFVALDIAKRQRPEVAVLDIGLPGISGYELAQQLHRTSGLEQVKLIALTGYGQDRDVQAAKSAGFAHHLTKPAPPELLAKLVSIQRRQTGLLP